MKFSEFIATVENLDYDQSIERYLEYVKDKILSSYNFFEEKISLLLNSEFKTLRQSMKNNKNIRNWALDKTPKKETVIDIVFELIDCWKDHNEMFCVKDIDFLGLCNELLEIIGISALYYRDPQDIIDGYCLKYQKGKEDREKIKAEIGRILPDSIPKLQINRSKTADLLEETRTYFEQLEYTKLREREIAYTTTFFVKCQEELKTDEELIKHCEEYSKHFCRLRHKTLKNLIEILDVTVACEAESVEKIKKVFGVRYEHIEHTTVGDDLSINKLNSIYRRFYGFGKDGYYSDDIIGFITQKNTDDEISNKRGDNTGLTDLQDILKGDKIVTRRNFLLWLIMCESCNEMCDLSNVDEALLDSEFMPVKNNEDRDTLSNLVSFAFLLNETFEEKVLGEILYDLYAGFVAKDMDFPLWA